MSSHCSVSYAFPACIAVTNREQNKKSRMKDVKLSFPQNLVEANHISSHTPCPWEPIKMLTLIKLELPIGCYIWGLCANEYALAFPDPHLSYGKFNTCLLHTVLRVKARTFVSTYFISIEVSYSFFNIPTLLAQVFPPAMSPFINSPHQRTKRQPQERNKSSCPAKSNSLD